MTFTPGKKPDARMIQKAYVNCRAYELNRLGDQTQIETVRAMQGDLNKNVRLRSLFYPESKAEKTSGKEFNYRKVEDYYEILNDSLQLRDLTINFHASAWFDSENNYETYTQIYQRGANRETGEMRLMGDKLNPPPVRGFFDDLVTLPQSWNTPERGLRPRGAGHSIAQRMQLGNEIPRVSGADKRELTTNLVAALNTNDPGMNLMDTVRSIGPRQPGVADPLWNEKLKRFPFKPKNENFQPDTRQIFVALNYGKRPHGSNVLYGYSHLVVHPRFKPDAIYFAGDTFNKSGVHEQISFQGLAAVYLRGSDALRQSLVESCIGGVTLGDTNHTDYLVEAHLFNSIQFGRYDIVELRLENEAWMEKKRAVDAQEPDYIPPQNPSPFNVVAANAETFCRRWGIKFRLL